MPVAFDTPTLLVVRTDMPADQLTQSVQRVLASIDPSLPIARVGSLQGAIDDTMAPQRLLLRLFLVFGSCALMLAAIGVYGLTAYVVERRQREMAVRVALGASPGSIEALVMRQGAAITVAGVSTGLLLALVLSRTVRDQLFGVSPIDHWAYAAVSFGLALIVVVACYLPARRAGRIDPVRALKREG
jgi:putative ABC transport system permease protein